MKKITLTVGCLLFFELASSAAGADRKRSAGQVVPKFRFGVEGVLSPANLYNRDLNEIFATHLWFVGGAFVDLPMGRGLELQPELLFEQKGGELNGKPYLLDDLKIPILLDITLLGPINLLAGPSLDSDLANQGLTRVDRMDLGLVLGFQLDLPPFFFSDRWETGLTGTGSDPLTPKGVFTLLLGFSFI